MPSLLVRLRTALLRPVRAALRRPEDPRLAAAVAVLAECPLFARFPPAARRVVADAMHVRRYARGEALYLQGDPAFGLYVVQDGLVRLTAETEEGEAEELHRLARGAVLGETALLGDFRRAETAEALRDTTVLGLFRPDLRALLRRERRVGLMATVAVAQRVAAREEALVQVLREGHLPAHRLLHRLPLDQPADPTPLLG